MPIPPGRLYGRRASDFDAATTLEKLPDEFRDLLESFVDGLAGPAVLDAGCGPGRDADYFRGRGLDPVGIDISRRMVEYAREHRPGRYLRMDIRDLAFDDARFDGVWCPASVFFVPTAEMETALAEFARVLRPDGIARVGFKLGDGPTEVEKWGATTMEYHVSRDEARALLESAGFRVESVTVNSLPTGTTFANCYCERAGSTPPSGE